ncbi:MAG: ribosomal RNA small subunit methyltransferase A [Acidobacteria bacterium]|nr:ribosomal RNA small subunit methyltransferase A [Acidobacteriota bacterium]MCG3192018.1 Ribosomal RNA small subunit methyltransferase A [Thermoanaerobaculia bacterium]
MTASRTRTGRQRLGQHFLKNAGIARRIALAVQAEEGDLVVEIGPGRGALTLPLLERGVRLLALEADPFLAERLAERLADRPARVNTGDALAADFAALFAELGVVPPVALAGNLPYESATPMMREFVRHPEWFSSLTVMIQKEVADRILSRPGGDAYGFLTLDVGAHARAERLFDVGPANFDPPPRVQSSVLRLTPRVPVEGTGAALALASAGFAHRRKMLQNALEPLWPKARVEEALLALGLPAQARAEVLSLSDFLALARLLSAGSGPEPRC